MKKNLNHFYILKTIQFKKSLIFARVDQLLRNNNKKVEKNP